MSACLCAGSLETLLWCGLALAACRRSCARHPPCPPAAAPAGALAEVCHLQQGSVLVLRLELSVRRGACGRAWEGAGGAAVSCPRCPVRAAACPCPLLLRSLRRCVPAAALRRVRSPRAKCRDGSREQLALQPASQLPPMQHPPPLAGQGPSVPGATVLTFRPLSPWLWVPYPFTLRDKAPSVRDSAGLGGQARVFSPRIPIRRGSMFTLVAGWGLQGLCAARHPPPPPAKGTGRGK